MKKTKQNQDKTIQDMINDFIDKGGDLPDKVNDSIQQREYEYADREARSNALRGLLIFIKSYPPISWDHQDLAWAFKRVDAIINQAMETDEEKALLRKLVWDYLISEQVTYIKT